MTSRVSARTKLLDAAISVIRQKGYSATSVDDLCAAAGVTKGAFFHHFKSKDVLGAAAADYWSETTSGLFKSAPYHDHEGALERVVGYIDFRAEIIAGGIEEFTCLVGTMTQEVYQTAPEIRQACAESIFGHAGTLVADIRAAIRDHDIQPHDWTAESLAEHTQAVLQGGFILAKASHDPQRAIQSVQHLKRYITLLFS